MTSSVQNNASAPLEHHVLEAHGLACGYGDDKTVFEGLDFSLESGDIKCLLGPNGAGKTTLFKTVLGFLKPRAGTLTFDGEDMLAWGRRRYAQMLGYIPQSHQASFSFTVLEVVLMGRTPHLGAMGNVSKIDEDIALQALDELGMADFAHRDYTMLSGGERQMVLVARVLAQHPAFLVMDEPTSALDMGNQVRVLEMVSRLAQKGYGILMTTHDPNQAFLLGGDVICLRRGGGYCTGKADEVLDEKLLHELYGCAVNVDAHERDGYKYACCTPIVDRGQCGTAALPPDGAAAGISRGE